MFRKTAIRWLAALALCVVAGSTMSSFVAWAASAASTDRGTGLVLFVPAHGERSLVGASRVVSKNVVSSVVSQQWTSHGWWGYCCTGDYSTHNAGWVPLLAPWGPPPITANSTAIERYLFNQINHDRAIRGLYLYSWNPTLVNGARLHSWNMSHCGFSHSSRMGITALDACVSRTSSLTTTIVARISPPQEVMGHSRAKKRVSGRFKKVW